MARRRVTLIGLLLYQLEQEEQEEQEEQRLDMCERCGRVEDCDTCDRCGKYLCEDCWEDHLSSEDDTDEEEEGGATYMENTTRTPPMSEARLEEIRALVAEVEQARDRLTALGGPEWRARARTRPPLLDAVHELLAEVDRYRSIVG